MTRPDSHPLLLCFGTRPQVIKASALLSALRAREQTLSVDTGQHYDYQLNALLYEQLGVARPDHFLEVGSGSHGEQTATILHRVEALITQVQPRAVIVIGDTNSTLGGALAAAKLRLPVVHVEAGLRAADHLLAEEINRRAVDAMSAVLCAPSRRTAARLEEERQPGRVVMTGDVARDVLVRNLSLIPSSNETAERLVPGGARFAFATFHRAELTDNPERLQATLTAVGQLGLPVLLPLHPRTRKVIAGFADRTLLPDTLHLLEPLGYLQSIACARDAAVVITDSGGVQREAYWLGTPCVTLRAETEWEETVECGANTVVGPDALGRLPEVITTRMAQSRGWDRDLLGRGDAAERIADAVQTI